MSRTLAILACGLLAACGTTAHVQTACLPLKPYTAAEQAALAAAMRALPEQSVIIGAMADYGAMRDADRACLGAKP